MKFDQLEHGAAILELLKSIGNDGHTIYRPKVLDGLPMAFKQRFVRVYNSDSSGKGDIFDSNGNILPELQGVYGLTVLEAICDDLGLQVESKTGRGFRAAAATSAIEKHFNVQQQTNK